VVWISLLLDAHSSLCGLLLPTEVLFIISLALALHFEDGLVEVLNEYVEELLIVGTVAEGALLHVVL